MDLHPPQEKFLKGADQTGSVDGYSLELAGDVPDEGSGVEGYIRVVAYLVQDRYR